MSTPFSLSSANISPDTKDVIGPDAGAVRRFIISMSNRFAAGAIAIANSFNVMLGTLVLFGLSLLVSDCDFIFSTKGLIEDKEYSFLISLNVFVNPLSCIKAMSALSKLSFLNRFLILVKLSKLLSILLSLFVLFFVIIPLILLTTLLTNSLFSALSSFPNSSSLSYKDFTRYGLSFAKAIEGKATASALLNLPPKLLSVKNDDSFSAIILS